MTEQTLQADIAEVRRQIAENSGWFMALGILLIVAGLAAIAFPLVSGIAVTILLGWILLACSALHLIQAFSLGEWRDFLLRSSIGLLYLVAGGLLALFPLSGIITLTILLAALFLAEGVLEILIAVRMRRIAGWGWLLASGVIAFVVGLLIAFELPSSANWAIGLLTGINLISSGWALVFLALAGRRQRTTPAPA
jgi:uncharacterized membrane protein HdeD (DUF308 family)